MKNKAEKARPRRAGCGNLGMNTTRGVRARRKIQVRYGSQAQAMRESLVIVSHRHLRRERV